MNGGLAEHRPSRRARAVWWVKRSRQKVSAAWRAVCDRAKWIGYQPGNSARHAEYELRKAGWFDKDGLYGDMMGRAVMRMVRDFADEGHSGMSANLAISLFKTVAAFEPLTPLTGEDEEWLEVGDGVFQNKRCSHVFRERGEAYDSTGRIFREPSGACYTSRDSRVSVTFPYTPVTEYVNVGGEDDAAAR